MGALGLCLHHYCVLSAYTGCGPALELQKVVWALASGARLLGAPSHNRRVVGSILSQVTYLGYGFDHPSRCMGGKQSVLFPLPPSLSLPLSLSLSLSLIHVSCSPFFLFLSKSNEKECSPVSIKSK